MNNKNAGLLLVGVAALIGIIIYLFNRALSEIVETSCSHGVTCPMWGTIEFQTNLSIVLMAFVALIGAYLIFFGKDNNTRTIIEPKKINPEDYKKVMETLMEDEKKVLEMVMSSQGTIFQSDLVNRTEFGKVRVTRILDRLESINLIERKRRGMTNMVILRHGSETGP